MKSRSVLVALGLAMLPPGPAATRAAAPEEAERALHSPADGVDAAVLYLGSAARNAGAGDPRWVATSGGRLSGQGTDPWGDDQGAFGLPEGAETGAAIAASIESRLLAGESGAVILCVRIPAIEGDPAIVINRGTWGNASAFDLRADKTRGLILYAGASGAAPQTLRLGRYAPDAWTFLALTWSRQGEGVVLDVCLGELGSGHQAEWTTHDLAQVGEPAAPVLIAGRTNRDLNPALLTGGMFAALAIYEHALPRPAIEGVLAAMERGARP